jgi:hypothetical protein
MVLFSVDSAERPGGDGHDATDGAGSDSRIERRGRPAPINRDLPQNNVLSTVRDSNASRFLNALSVHVSSGAAYSSAAPVVFEEFEMLATARGTAACAVMSDLAGRQGRFPQLARGGRMNLDAPTESPARAQIGASGERVEILDRKHGLVLFAGLRDIHSRCQHQSRPQAGRPPSIREVRRHAGRFAPWRNPDS